ncbi:MAG: hypothetical protein KJ061_13450, partial [Vicinamibacteraceae bacterium]|nr:hypothetical protein [Vicinamibacteraceae bacterium]
FVMSAGLAVALLERGWRATTAPGRPVVLERNGDRLDPFTRLGALADGTLTPAAWQDECQRLGLAGTPLGRGQ